MEPEPELEGEEVQALTQKQKTRHSSFVRSDRARGIATGYRGSHTDTAASSGLQSPSAPPLILLRNALLHPQIRPGHRHPPSVRGLNRALKQLVRDKWGRVLRKLFNEERIYDHNIATVWFFEIRAEANYINIDFQEVQEEVVYQAPAPSTSFLSRIPWGDIAQGILRGATRSRDSRETVSLLLRWFLRRGAGYIGAVHYAYIHFEYLQIFVSNIATFLGWW
jgi:hypothetical protein